ncbi:unnamed protein product, partial [Meganyctiphanes norvegica]
ISMYKVHTNLHEEPQKDMEDENQLTSNGSISCDKQSPHDEVDKKIADGDKTSHDGQVNEESKQIITDENKKSSVKLKKSSCTCSHDSCHPQPSSWHIACTRCVSRQRLQRKKSSIWNLNGIFDTYKTFEVEHEDCYDLKVTVHRGENISKGSRLKDAFDTPDPYIILRIPEASLNTPKRTTTEDDSTNPTWNQTFHFYLYKSPSKPYMMEISLMDENVLRDEAIDTQLFDLDCLEEGMPKDCTITFNGNSKIFITFLIQKNQKTDLRFSMSLCDDEKSYLRQRRLNVLQSMKTLLGEDGPHAESEVPTIGILGSGGGFRAMIGLSGALRALQDSGLLDCTTYLAGLSGSTWCISTLYSQDLICDNSTSQEKKNECNQETDDNIDFSNINISTEKIELKSTKNFRGSLNVKEFQKTLCVSVGKNWEWNILKMPQYLADMLSNYWKGQSLRPVSFVDIFGHLIGDVLLGKEKKHLMKLSDLQARISDGKAPFPLFSALHATDRSSDKFSEWIEFSPYEIGIGKYGTFMKTEHFGSKFFAGKLLKKFDEMPLYCLQGMWGSAFTINLKKHLRGDTSSLTEDIDEYTDESSCPNNKEDSDSDTDSDDSEGAVEDFSGRRSYLKMKKQSVDKAKRKKRSEKKNWFVSALETVGIDSSHFLNTRAVKPGRIYNPFNGLSLRYSFAKSPSTPEIDTTIDKEDGFKFADGCKFQPISQDSKKISVMDSGFAFNSPYPLLLRPQRCVDIFLSFDFSAREEDLLVSESSFRELLKAEKWAEERHIPFPPVREKIDDYLGTDLQECYVFESTNDSCVPVILHFPLVNNKFRQHKSPGSSEEELAFSEFPCFGKDSEFSTFKFNYDSKEFHQLAKVMEFNTLLHKDTIIKTMKNSIINKKQGNKLGFHEIAKILMWQKGTGKGE